MYPSEPLFDITFAGAPTITELSSTSRVTTLFTPIATLLPTRIPPNILAPDPIYTLLPIIGVPPLSPHMQPQSYKFE